MPRKEDSTYESKYDELSGMSGILTTTPYGLLMDILTYTDVKIYLFVIDLKNIQFSLDKVSWETLNRGLGKRLLDLSDVLDNIIIYEDWRNKKRSRNGK